MGWRGRKSFRSLRSNHNTVSFHNRIKRQACFFRSATSLTHLTMVKIFIIDDNEDFVLLFCNAVTRMHPECQCLSAENGYNALRQLKFMLPTVPDFIFVDVKMPIM